MIANTVQISSKNVYGLEKIYPANAAANIFAELTNKKTFALADLKLIESLGFKIETVSKPVVF